jgi:hypothetical protein
VFIAHDLVLAEEVAGFARRTNAAKFPAARRSAGEPLAIAGKKPLAVLGCTNASAWGRSTKKLALSTPNIR